MVGLTIDSRQTCRCISTTLSDWTSSQSGGETGRLRQQSWAKWASEHQGGNQGGVRLRHHMAPKTTGRSSTVRQRTPKCAPASNTWAILCGNRWASTLCATSRSLSAHCFVPKVSVLQCVSLCASVYHHQCV